MDIIDYLIKNDAYWFIKDDYGKYFYDYLDKDEIINKYPKEYKKSLNRKKAKKYNIL